MATLLILEVISDKFNEDKICTKVLSKWKYNDDDDDNLYLQLWGVNISYSSLWPSARELISNYKCIFPNCNIKAQYF